MNKHKLDEKWTDEVGYLGTDKISIEWTEEERVAYKAIVDKAHNERTPEERMQIKFDFLKTKMWIYLQQDEPFKSVGAFLKEHLEIVGVTNKVFADFVEIETEELMGVLNGKEKLSLDLALLLGQLFKASAKLWISIQNKNQLLLLKEKESKKSKKVNFKKLAKKAS